MLVLFSSRGIFNLLSCFLKEKLSLDLEGLSLIERKFDLRESLSLGSKSFLLKNDFSFLVGNPFVGGFVWESLYRSLGESLGGSFGGSLGRNLGRRAMLGEP